MTLGPEFAKPACNRAGSIYRAHGPQEANLFDMGQKYADLLSVGEIMAALWSHTESVMEGAKSA